MSLTSLIGSFDRWTSLIHRSYRYSAQAVSALHNNQRMVKLALSALCCPAAGYALYEGRASAQHQQDRASSANSVMPPPPSPSTRPTPPEEDHTLRLPRDILYETLGWLDGNDLLAVNQVCMRWRAYTQTSEVFWRFCVEKRCGYFCAVILKQDRDSWKQVMDDLDRPVPTKSRELSNYPFKMSLSLHKSRNKQLRGQLKSVMTHIENSDSTGLRASLDELKRAGQLEMLNARPWGYIFLERAAFEEDIELTSLLIRYGARDAVRGDEDTSKDGITGYSALYWAARSRRVETVGLLLEHGARPDLNLEERGYNRPFLATLLEDLNSNDKQCLKCLILLINAWKTQKGHQAVCESEEGQLALASSFLHRLSYDPPSMALHLLLALGIRPRFEAQPWCDPNSPVHDHPWTKPDSPVYQQLFARFDQKPS